MTIMALLACSRVRPSFPMRRQARAGTLDNDADNPNTIALRNPPAPPFSTPIDLQLQSPLFGKLPAEIRNRIYILATTAYPDEEKHYPFQKWQYRPDLPYQLRIDTALLLTCRRAYEEARLIPIANNTHTIYSNKLVKGRYNPNLAFRFPFLKSPADLRQHVTSVHLVGMQKHMVDFFLYMFDFLDVIGRQLKHLKVSLRYTDERTWEYIRAFHNVAARQYTDPWYIAQHMQYGFRKMPLLEEFEVELEVPKRKQQEFGQVNWFLDTVAPIPISETRQLAYVTYGEIWTWLGKQDDSSRQVGPRRGRVRRLRRSAKKTYKKIWNKIQHEMLTEEYCVRSVVWRSEEKENKKIPVSPKGIQPAEVEEVKSE